MTKEDIIRMVDEAKLIAVMEMFEYEVARFAALVAAAERNKLAQWMIDHSYATGHGDTVEDLLGELEWQVREAEREACAKVCDEAKANIWEFHPYAVREAANSVCTNLAAAIRARGQT